MKVLFVYRSKLLRQYSIERCFQLIKDKFSSDIEISELCLPEPRADMISIYKNILYLKRYLKKNAFDIIQITGDVHYAVLGVRDIPTVLTMHDLRGMQNYAGIKKNLFRILWIILPYKRAAAVVTISNSTDCELKRYADFKKCKSTIIPDPLDDRFVYNDHIYNPKLPRVLMIGTNSNKNLERVIEALDGVPCILDIVGPLDSRYIDRLECKGIKYYNSTRLTDREIYNKYCECDIVLFPSMYEGFGMIIIEAQSVGRPVITSNIEPMISVAGDAACMVDPFSVKSIHDGIIRVMNDAEYRDQLVSSGRKNSEKYKSIFVARAYETLYRSLLRE